MVSLNSPSPPSASRLSACSRSSLFPFNHLPYLCCLYKCHEGPTARELLWCRGEALAAVSTPAGLQQVGQPLRVPWQHHGMEQDETAEGLSAS